MRYFRTNTLFIEFPTTFLGNQVTARLAWKIAWTSLTGDKVRFIPKGSKLAGKSGKKGYTTNRNLILIDIYTSKEDFIDAISRYFSEKLNVNVHDLNFKFKSPTPLGGDLNA